MAADSCQVEQSPHICVATFSKVTSASIKLRMYISTRKCTEIVDGANNIRVTNQPFLKASGATRRHYSALLCSGDFSRKASIALPYYCHTRQDLFSVLKTIRPVSLFKIIT
jgi:hypothetical protein